MIYRASSISMDQLFLPHGPGKDRQGICYTGVSPSKPERERGRVAVVCSDATLYSMPVGINSQGYARC